MVTKGKEVLPMGMAAGQARLLSITARLSDNEQNGQALSFAKQRLADEADQVNREYNEALNATKLTVLTGFNGAEAQYTDISYGLLTEYNKLAAGKQYLVTNQKGQILVTKEIADAYKAGNGDFNVFINKFGLSQTDVDFKSTSMTDADKYQLVHDAWDKYLTSVGLSFEDVEHDYSNPNVEFGVMKFTNNGGVVTGESSYMKNTTLVSGISVPDTDFWNRTDYGVAEDGCFIPDATFTNIDANGNAIIPNLPLGKTYNMHIAINEDDQTPIYVTHGTSADNKVNDVCYYLCETNNDGQLEVYSYVRNSRLDWAKISKVDDVTNIEATNYSNSYNVPVGAVKIGSSSTGEAYTYKNVVQPPESGVTLIKTSSMVSPINFEGTTKEQRELYDYAVALTKSYAGQDGNSIKSIADNPENAAEIQYYRNIFDEMHKFGYVTEADLNINQAPSAQRANVVSTGVKDNNWFEQGLRQGKLLLKTYDASKGAFVNTTYAEDSNIQEVEDDRRIAKAQVDYDQAQEALERKDKKIDLELKKLDTEHNALQTEYESVKNVVDKNIEKSFNIFS